MVTEITNGVKVSVETEYQPEYSSPSQQHFVFTYRISIENASKAEPSVSLRKDSRLIASRAAIGLYSIPIIVDKALHASEPPHRKSPINDHPREEPVDVTVDAPNVGRTTD